MLKPLIGKAVRVVDDVGLATALTLAFVALVAGSAGPLYAVEVSPDRRPTGGPDDAATGTVVQMPATPSGSRATRAAAVREPKGVARTPAPAPKTSRVRRPDPVDDGPSSEELDQLRAPESTARITIIGPDGQPRTKIVRLSGSRDGMSAPARRPHD